MFSDILPDLLGRVFPRITRCPPHHHLVLTLSWGHVDVKKEGELNKKTGGREWMDGVE